MHKGHKDPQVLDMCSQRRPQKIKLTFWLKKNKSHSCRHMSLTFHFLGLSSVPAQQPLLPVAGQ